jgi:hypothetical protein
MYPITTRSEGDYLYLEVGMQVSKNPCHVNEAEAGVSIVRRPAGCPRAFGTVQSRPAFLMTQSGWMAPASEQP